MHNQRFLTTPALDQQLLRVATFGGAPIVLISLVRLTSEVAADAGQMLIGTLAAVGIAMSMVLIGMVGACRSVRD